MITRTKHLIAWMVFGLCLAGLVLQVWFSWLTRSVPTGGEWNSNGSFFQNLLFAVLLLSFPIVGLLIARRRPENPIGWLLLGSGLAWAFSGGQYALYGVVIRPMPMTSLMLSIGQWTWVVAIGLLGTFTILLFPDGRPPSPRWRWLGWLSGIVIVFGSVTICFYAAPIQVTPNIAVDNPLGIDALFDVFDFGHLLIVVLPACIIASAVGLVVRFRRSSGVERQQIRWLAYAGAIVALFYFGVMAASLPHAFTGTPTPGWVQTLQLYAVFSFALIPAAIGVAVLRYHLWDLDLVISKTLVLGSLVAFITIVYVAMVVGVGTLIGNSRNPALSIAATAVVALLFGPVRERVRRFANRLVYGRRATPYEVMSGFARRVSWSISVDHVLPEMAEVAARGVGARAARVRVTLPDGEERASVWPDHTGGPYDRSLDVIYQGDVIGAIEVAMGADQPLRPSEVQLLEDLAGQAGLAFHNVRLTEELTIRARELAVRSEELRVSRERLVTARDAQRRGLERDIREGPERRLHEIRGELALVGLSEPPTAEVRLDALIAHANDTLEGLRDLARGIFPPLLGDQGVVAALEAHVRKVRADAQVRATPAFTGQRFAPDVEACIYFCCLQAIQNVIRHAGNGRCTVSLDADEDSIRFTLSDEGSGFDPTVTPRGMGMDIMQDRIDALEGTLSIMSAPGTGTTVMGTVPRRAVTEIAS